MPTYPVDLEIPPLTSADEPVERRVEIKEGVVTNWMLLIPPGHLALAGIRVLYGLDPILPAAPDSWIKGDGESLNFPEFFDPPEQPYELRVQGYNTDETFPHTFYLRIVVMPRKIAYLHQEFLKRQAQLIGQGVTSALMRAWGVI